MELLWIAISIFAALLQVVRTAGQKQLNAHLSTTATTGIRSLFGMPFLVVYLLAVEWWSDAPLPDLGTAFWLYTLGASLTQVVATWLLLVLFTMRNFAVGTVLPKFDIVLTAILGLVIFGEAVTLTGWVGIAAAALGVGFLSAEKFGGIAVVEGPSGEATRGAGRLGALFSPAILTGFAAALGFTLSYLFLREASLALNEPFVRAAAWTVNAVVLLQVIGFGIWFVSSGAAEQPTVRAHWRPSLFVGITSAVGSIGWFTAMTLVNAAYVKAVGQIEAVFALAISAFYFRERVSRTEMVGMALIVASVLVFLL